MVRLVIMAALAAAPLANAFPAQSAELEGHFGDHRRGAFAGLKLKATSGGTDNSLRAALAFAPTQHSRIGANNRVAMGSGLELGISPREKPTLTLADQRLDRISLFAAPEKDRANLSTLGTVAIVAGVIVVVGGLAFKHLIESSSCFHGDGGDC